MSTFLPRTTSTPVRIGRDFGELHGRRWHGHGPPVLLIHGISGAASSWFPIIDDLAEVFNPITLDLRGHGDSAKPASGYLYPDYIADLDAALNALELDHPLIVGHSLGGIVTLWWAATQPDRAAGLAIEDAPLRSGEAFRPAFDRWTTLNAMSRGELRAHYAAEYPDWSDDQLDERSRLMNGTAAAVFSELRADSLAHEGVDRIAEITGIVSPVLLVHGDLASGGMVVPGDAAELATRLPNARTIRVPESGHTLHRDRKAEFLAVVLPFLRQHAAIAT